MKGGSTVQKGISVCKNCIAVFIEILLYYKNCNTAEMSKKV
jgi:hypothetical protein